MDPKGGSRGLGPQCVGAAAHGHQGVGRGDEGAMTVDLLCLLMVLTLAGLFDGLDVRFQYTSEFLCHLLEW